MKPIKFRAYRPKAKIMIYDSRVFQILAYLQDDYKDVPWIVMQYTGLKDKNGREIYEGDIVKIETWRIPMFVYWENRFAKFLYVTRKQIETRKEYNMGNIEGCVEVIGNLYESKHLLEK